MYRLPAAYRWGLLALAGAALWFLGGYAYSTLFVLLTAVPA